MKRKHSDAVSTPVRGKDTSLVSRWLDWRPAASSADPFENSQSTIGKVFSHWHGFTVRRWLLHYLQVFVLMSPAFVLLVLVKPKTSTGVGVITFGIYAVNMLVLRATASSMDGGVLAKEKGSGLVSGFLSASMIMIMLSWSGRDAQGSWWPSASLEVGVGLLFAGVLTVILTRIVDRSEGIDPFALLLAAAAVLLILLRGPWPPVPSGPRICSSRSGRACCSLA